MVAWHMLQGRRPAAARESRRARRVGGKGHDPRGVLGLLTVSLALAVTACSGDDAPSGPNQPPTVTLDASSVESDPASYRVLFSWEGADADGRVDHYRYALSPPDAFTTDEILHGGPGLTETRLPDEGTLGVIRVTKIVDGAAVFFDWVLTRELSRLFTFAAPPLTDPGPVELPQRFFVRAVDDDGAPSVPDWAAFTSKSLLPFTEGLAYEAACDPDEGRELVELAWTGHDPDAHGGEGKPAGYLVKLVDMSAIALNLGITPDPNWLFYQGTPDVPWTPVPGETQVVTLDPSRSYAFAVRAVDDAGAEERWLGWSSVFGMEPAPGSPTNAVLFNTFSQRVVSLTVSEPSLGTQTFQGTTTPPVRYEIFQDEPLHFTWHASAESYGGVIEGYNWGVNIPDLERDGPNSGWRGWSTETGNAEPVVFHRPGVNFLYVQARDACGLVAVAGIQLTVLEREGSRELLIVDDTRDQTWPRDDMHDAFWLNLARNSGRLGAYDARPEVVLFHAHGPNDVFFDYAMPPDLKTLGRYRTVLFDTHGAGFNGRCALNGSLRVLERHARAGGTLWITGAYTGAAMIPNVTGASTIVYPLAIPPESFPHRVLKIRSPEFRNDKSAGNDVNGMVAVRPFAGAPEGTAAMTVDQFKLTPILRDTYGVGACDVLFDPVLEPDDPDFRGVIEPLYAFGAIGPTRTPPVPSVYDGKLTGLRWHDPDPARGQGRTMWFGFPMYYFHDAEAQETFNRALDWFREETAP